MTRWFSLVDSHVVHRFSLARYVQRKGEEPGRGGELLRERMTFVLKIQ